MISVFLSSCLLKFKVSSKDGTCCIFLANLITLGLQTIVKLCLIYFIAIPISHIFLTLMIPTLLDGVNDFF